MTTAPHLLPSLLLLSLLLAACAARQRYDRHRLFDYRPSSGAQLRLVHALSQQYPESGMLDFWREAAAVNKTGTFLAHPRVANRIADRLAAAGVALHQRPVNVQRLVTRQRRQNRFQRFFVDDFARQPHTYYMRYADMYRWLQNQMQYCMPPLRCSLKTIGTSPMSRRLLVMRISKGNNKPLIWIDAGIHPREWIAPATAIFVIKKLLENDDEASRLLDRFEFAILPLMNPDGYEYTHTHSRFWRKNLQPSNFYCTGVDLNRNFGYEWGGTGSSSNPCADNYRGRGPFSEPETAFVKKFLTENKQKLKVFLTLHSYGQYILTPFGNRKAFYPANKRQLMNLGQRMALRIEAFSGRFYDVGSAADLLYEAAGGSTDFASAHLGVPYSYTIELPDTGRYAFFLPPQYILHVGKEIWNALKEVGKVV